MATMRANATLDRRTLVVLSTDNAQGIAEMAKTWEVTGVGLTLTLTLTLNPKP